MAFGGRLSSFNASDVRRSVWLSGLVIAALFVVGLVSLQSRPAQIALLMWRHGLTACALAYGQAGEAPILASYGLRPEDAYKLASLSKPITAAAILKLVDAGKLSLDDKVGNATIGQLLQHSGGWDRAVAGDPFCNADESLPKQFEPGSRYAYSNLGYCLLSREIERRSGVPYERYVLSVLPKAAGLRVGIPELGGAGGWVGTPSDYFAFASEPLSPLVTKRPSYALPGETYYGFGWRVWPDGALSHFGLLPGTYSVVFRRGDYVVVGVFDGDPRDPEALTRELKRILLPASG